MNELLASVCLCVRVCVGGMGGGGPAVEESPRRGYTSVRITDDVCCTAGGGLESGKLNNDDLVVVFFQTR